MEEQRIVKGIYVPIDIWKSKDLSWNEKILFLEIDSFTSREKDCYVSNEYIMELLGVTERSARRIMSHLIELGLIEVVKFDGRRRYVRSAMSFSYRAEGSKSYRADRTQMSGQRGHKSPGRPDTKVLHTNNNLLNNKSIKEIIPKGITKKVSFDFKQELINIGVSEDVASAWMLVRHNKRATNSEIAFNKIRREIAKAGMTADDAIRIAVENSWSGFDVAWVLKERKVAPKKESTREMNERLTREAIAKIYGKSVDNT